MEPDRRKQVSDLYHAALLRPAEDRNAFLREACDGDAVLREEVESLLRFESASAGFLERPAAGVITPGAADPPASRDMVGRQLGPYTILSPLGAGGMGEVYRARDRKLGRDVALKILPSHFTSDPSAVRASRAKRGCRHAQPPAHRRDLWVGRSRRRHGAGARVGRGPDARRSTHRRCALHRATSEGTCTFGSAPTNQQRDLGIWLVNPDGSGLRPLVRPGIAPTWSPDGSSVYFTQVRSVGLFKIPADGSGQQTTVRTDMLRNFTGSHGTTVYMLVERIPVDGLPVLQIGAAEPEDGPFRLLAEVSLSRVPPWQILNPTLSPDGEWIAMPLVDGLSTNIWTLSTSSGAWRQITDFTRPTFIARRVSWSSDGRSILAAVAEGDADIFRLDGLLNDGRD